MNLGLFRRENLQSGDSKMVGEAVVDQFQRTHGALTAWQEVEHTDDGHHTDIHATSITVDPGGITAEGDIVSGDGGFTGEDGNVAIGDLPNEGTPLQSGGYGIKIGQWRIISDPNNSPSTPSFQGLIFQYLGEHIGNFMFRFIRLGVYDWAFAPQTGVQVAMGWGTNRLSNVVTAALQCIGLAQVGSLAASTTITGDTITAGTVVYSPNFGTNVPGGAYYEYGRATAMGYWLGVAHSPTLFTTYNAGGTFSVPAGSFNYRYTIIGKTLHVLYAYVGCTVTAAGIGLITAFPAGISIGAFVPGIPIAMTPYSLNNGVIANPAYIQILSPTTWGIMFAPGWANAAGTSHFYGTFTVEIA